MKRLYTLLTLLLMTGAIHAQTIPNNSFEDWYPYNTGTFSGEFPNSWTTSDSLSQALAGGISAFRATDGYSGTYALHLRSTRVTYLVFQFNAPGVATNGNFALVGTTLSFTGGSPDTARSRVFTGQYKYAPAAAGDACVLSVAKLRWNGTSRDTIAIGSDTLEAAASTYTPFTVDLVYRDFINRPDTCLILLLSSRALNDPQAAVGSELVVDDIAFSGFVGVDEVSDVVENLQLYPSPASTMLHMNAEFKHHPGTLRASILDITGKQVLQVPVSGTSLEMDVSALPEGTYLFNLLDDRQAILTSRRFTVAR